MAINSKQREKYSLNRQLTNLTREISRLKSLNDEINGKVSRLQSVYNELGYLKSSSKQIKNNAKTVTEKKYKWKGNKYNDFSRDGGYLEDEYNQYINSIDRVRDAINDEICNLKNSFSDNFGALGRLKSMERTVKTKIKNLVN